MTLTGSWWIDAPIIAAAVLVAWLTLWRQGLGPTFRAARHYTEDQAVLREIADQFRPNSGKSLHDVLQQVRSEMSALADDVHLHVEADRRAFIRVERRQKRMEDRIIGGNDEIIRRVDDVQQTVGEPPV